jgi:hypothetical protein
MVRPRLAVCPMSVCRSVSHHDLKSDSDKTTYGEAQVSCLPHDGVCRSVSHHDLKRESDKTTYGEAQVGCLPHDGVCRSVSHHDCFTQVHFQLFANIPSTEIHIDIRFVDM